MQNNNVTYNTVLHYGNKMNTVIFKGQKILVSSVD